MPNIDREHSTDELEAVLASMLPDGVDPATMSLEAVARRAELVELYDGMYRQLSVSHAHPSLLSLSSIWHTTADHRTEGVQWGPERVDEEDFKTFLLLVCTVMFYLAARWASLLVQVHGGQPEFLKRLEQVGEKYHFALGYPSSGTTG